jgi:hypothetical protein
MTGYFCSACGSFHPERPTCWNFDLPVVVAALSETEREQRVDMSSDQCILDGEHFFILGNLDVPIKNSSESLVWSAWSTLSKKNFERASELWEAAGRESEPPYFGWLSNQIPGYPDSVNIKALVHTQPVGIRPRIEVIEEDHPLREEQHSGISAARADAIIHAAMEVTAD